MNSKTLNPKKTGFYFPAEWEPHYAVWVSWIHKKSTFPEVYKEVLTEYCEFIKEICKSEIVRINVCDLAMKVFAERCLLEHDVELSKVQFYFHPTNDTWCRDYGPAFLVNFNRTKKIIVNWEYNSWGNKYPPFDLDNKIPKLVAKNLNIPFFNPNIIIEGGSVEFNGNGTILTSRSCLLNSNRNPNLDQKQIEKILCDYYGQEQVLWISHGILGDDTDGHIDCTVRFINHNTVLVVVEKNKFDPNYAILSRNLKELSKLRFLNGDFLNIIELPMPQSIFYKTQRLPASYANFYIANHAVLVPIFKNKYDDKALEIIQSCFPDRKIIGINCLKIIYGLGSLHCLTQQEPKIINEI